MFISVSHIGVKQDQDFTWCNSGEEKQALVVCDGIGQYEESGKAARFIVDSFQAKFPEVLENMQAFVSQLPSGIKQEGIVGGSTFICASVDKRENVGIDILYLGDGGILHIPGNFAQLANSSFPYRYADLMLPDITPEGALNKHISFNSGEEELSLSRLKMNLKKPSGDILLFFSDGISSLGEKVILQDGEERFWRHEAPAVQVLLKELDVFLREAAGSDFQSNLTAFNKEILDILNDQGLLEDDASLGIIINQKVLDFYQSLTNR